MQVERILEACVYVSDLNAAAEFYRRVLGLEEYARLDGRHVFFRCGQAMFLLFNPEQTQKAELGMGAHGAFGVGHVAFAMRESELEAWRDQLHAQNVPIAREIHWPNGGHSIYFHDPSGNSVELATPQLWGIAE